MSESTKTFPVKILLKKKPMPVKEKKTPLSPAHIAGICFLPAALLLGFIRVDLAILPLFFFLASCAIAPFFPRLSFFLPVVNRGKTGKRAVALTFDDGPDPVSTPILLRLLSERRVHATFFINGHKALRYPALIHRILQEGHSLGNHSQEHDNLLMLRSETILNREILQVQQGLENFGVVTHAFRPPVCITNPKLAKVLSKMDMVTVGFSCRGPDGGNRWVKTLSSRILKKVRPDDIILLHDVMPPNKELLSVWCRELEAILQGLAAKGFAVMDLSALIGREVMSRLPEKEIRFDHRFGQYR